MLSPVIHRHLRPLTALFLLASPLAHAEVASPNASQEAFTKREIEAIVRNLIRDNPELIRDALLALQAKEETSRNLQRVKVLSQESNAIFSDPNAPVLGNPNGRTVLVEYLDYNCGYCKRAHADILRLVAEDKDLKVVLKQLPLLGKESIDAAHVALAVHKVAPDRFAEFHTRLYATAGPIDLTRAIGAAYSLGIDTSKLKPLLLGPDIAQIVAANVDQATRLQLTGTPVFITPNDIVIGAMGYDVLREKIQKSREAAPR